jgi:hypothetical protein
MRIGALTPSAEITAAAICLCRKAAAISVVPPNWRTLTAPSSFFLRNNMRVMLSVKGDLYAAAYLILY